MENFLLESFDLASIYDITTGELYALCDQIKDGSLENTVDVYKRQWLLCRTMMVRKSPIA